MWVALLYTRCLRSAAFRAIRQQGPPQATLARGRVGQRAAAISGLGGLVGPSTTFSPEAPGQPARPQPCSSRLSTPIPEEGGRGWGRSISSGLVRIRGPGSELLYGTAHSMSS
ncbi:hypothetical protein NDU88_004943 [Pleurodeles waltl]|uniref:Uncharacterized protein n=1 Tax=Pleurodeles waltl TaxID=8319 RepID=A0AAV7LSG9_PLEWA|nr:hypothetical protein NDU88_004943 [Pleurodeles waltl]